MDYFAKKNHSCALILLDDNLRINDNILLFEGLKNHQQAIILFVLNEQDFRIRGGANKWFLHHCLQSLAQNLQKLNLTLFYANSNDHFNKNFDNADFILEIIKEQAVTDLYLTQSFDRRSEIYHQKLKNICKNHKVLLHQYNLKTLFNPALLKNKSDSFFKVFTPFWQNCLKLLPEINLSPIASIENISDIATMPTGALTSKFFSNNINNLRLIVNNPSAPVMVDPILTFATEPEAPAVAILTVFVLPFNVAPAPKFNVPALVVLSKLPLVPL